MEITLHLSEPKFQKGDVVKWGPGELIVHIWRVEAHGKWSYLNGDAGHDWDGTYHYQTTVLAGKGPEDDVIRPGTIVGFPEHGEEDHQLRDAVKIEWDGPILEADNMDNIGERWNGWPLEKKNA